MPVARATGVQGVVRKAVARGLSPLSPRSKKALRAQLVLERPGAVIRRWDRWRGREAFEFPGTASLLDAVPWPPDVVHCHNLHGDYFDLRYLSQLSQAAPLTLTLHDEWLYTGHCAYTLGCDRWRQGCGECPDLTLYPAVRRDATASNRARKQAIYRESSFYVGAPSRWLLERARASILADGAADFRVIPNGVDRSVFSDTGRREARRRLGVEDDARVLLFAANRARSNPFKDQETVMAAALRVGQALTDGRVILISLGEAGPNEQTGNSEIWHLGYEADPERVADHYRAADLYLHGAHADNAPMTILEALSCGTPVVATAVGGIPEQVHSLAGVPGAWEGAEVVTDRATGALVPEADPEAMAAAAATLLADRALLGKLSRNAVADVEARFTIEHQIEATLAWYRDARDDRASRAAT